jgi:hypothetical protein
VKQEYFKKTGNFQMKALLIPITNKIVISPAELSALL